MVETIPANARVAGGLPEAPGRPAASRAPDSGESAAKPARRALAPKHLRQPMTPAERSFWASVRLHSRLRDRIAHRAWVGEELVSFVCHDVKLAIEVGGDAVLAERAASLEACLRPLGYGVLRIAAGEILRDVRDVRAVCDRLAALLDLIAAETPRRRRAWAALPRRK